MLLAAVLALASCTGGDGEPSGGPSQSSGTKGGASPAPTSALDADPAKAPRDRAAARALAGEVIADPAQFGPEAVRATPYESDPGRRPVLGDDCVWRQEPLPDGVLATLSRHFEVPPAAGKDTARLLAVVTVHRTAEEADWENAGMLEEMLRCPEQQLGAGERLKDLISSASYYGDSANLYADDVLRESGDYRGAGAAATPYAWMQMRLGQVTVSVSVRAGRGYDMAEAQDIGREAGIRMLQRVETALGRDGAGGEDTEGMGADGGQDGGAEGNGR
ncbi:hypothetical protein O7599_11525 [Streptomyces sp. WMMC500]|uniref:hypothetical protein n=1 Tax=Streptomyces sp. WMMC500 TaxID=3015154 RepID=UPI00248B748D|nr:hypothetical protein [Streptomyces sp. WMMC500]WBB63111.1 hypothetical protein O7599_11525 [Streptomyces sp. WMMC500]